MHELSIATEIINIVGQYVDKGNHHRVQTVKVKIGKLTNVLTDSLQFCFEAIVKDSELNEAKLEIENVPLKFLCDDCNETSTTGDYLFKCLSCESSNIKIIAGDELNVSEIILKDQL